MYYEKSDVIHKAVVFGLMYTWRNEKARGATEVGGAGGAFLQCGISYRVASSSASSSYAWSGQLIGLFGLCARRG